MSMIGSRCKVSTTINFNIIQNRQVIGVESWVITSESRVKSESYRGWDSSRVASHQNVTRVESQVVSPQLWFVQLVVLSFVHFTMFEVNWFWSVRCITNARNEFFKLANSVNANINTRGQHVWIVPASSRIDTRKYVFTERVVRVWNALPAEQRHFSSLIQFKNFVNSVHLSIYVSLEF